MKVDPTFSFIDDLRRKLDEGLIDLGQMGEVVMRFLLRMAYVDAIIREQKNTVTPNFSMGCGFVTFLTALFASTHHASVLERGPDNVVEASPLHDAFENAVVRFTHSKAAVRAVMTTRVMAAGFLRGAAIIGSNNQEGIDIAIPILLNKDEKIKEASMSAFLMQVKRRHERGTVNAYLIDAENLGFFPDESAQKATPYVTLVAELAAKPPPEWQGNADSGKSPVRSSARRLSPHLERYSIRAYECTHKTWNVIRANEFDHYRQIMSLDDLFGDHPSQDEASLEKVRQQLPFWYSDSDWVADEVSDEAMVPISGHEDVEMEQTGLGESMVTD
jgi:hypothetical protein